MHTPLSIHSSGKRSSSKCDVIIHAQVWQTGNLGFPLRIIQIEEEETKDLGIVSECDN